MGNNTSKHDHTENNQAYNDLWSKINEISHLNSLSCHMVSISNEDSYFVKLNKENASKLTDENILQPMKYLPLTG